MKSKKNSKNTYFYLANSVGIVTYIFLYATCMSSLYTIQKNQKKIVLYKKEKEEYEKKLIFLQNSAHVKKYAKNVLHMQPLSLEKIKKIVVTKERCND